MNQIIKEKFKLRKQIRKQSIPFLVLKFGKVCWYCGLPLVRRRMMTIDHIIPVSKGGDLFDLNNLAITCSQCNKAKSNKSLEQFTQWLEHVRSSKFKNRMLERESLWTKVKQFIMELI